MSVSIKLLLLKPGDKLGNGLAAIRTHEADMIDISDYEAGISDPTITTCPGFVIKDNVVYHVIRSYFDLDKNCRLFIAKKEMEPFDVYPVPEEASKE